MDKGREATLNGRTIIQNRISANEKKHSLELSAFVFRRFKKTLFLTCEQTTFGLIFRSSTILAVCLGKSVEGPAPKPIVLECFLELGEPAVLFSDASGP